MHVRAIQTHLASALKQLYDRAVANRQLVEDEAQARVEASQARYKAAKAEAERDRAVATSSTLQRHNEVLEKRLKDSEELHRRTETQLKVRSAFNTNECCSG
jgi:hypothetical protein